MALTIACIGAGIECDVPVFDFLGGDSFRILGAVCYERWVLIAGLTALYSSVNSAESRQSSPINRETARKPTTLVPT